MQNKDEKHSLIKDSVYFSEMNSSFNNNKTSKILSDKDTNNPFYKMASSGDPKDQLYIAKNRNSTPEALRLLKDSDDPDIQKALAANPNTPQEVLDNLEAGVVINESFIRNSIETEWNEEFQKIEWDGSGSIDASSADSNLGTENIARWLKIKESPRRREEMDRILNDPNTPESRKQILREKIKEAKKQNAEESRLNREAKQNAQAAKKQEEKQKQKEKEDLAKVKKEELAAAKKGEVSQENLKRGRALNFLVEGMDKDQRKDVHSSLKEEMAHLNKLAESKRKDELKRARKGDFSGVEIPEENEPLGSADIQHYKEIKKLKKQNEIKRARKGDFSGVEIPTDTSKMSKEEQKHYGELSKLKKQNEIKRARKGDFSGVEIPTDTSKMSKEEQKHYGELSKLKKQKEQKDKRTEKEQEKNRKKEIEDRKKEAIKGPNASKQNTGLPDARSMVGGILDNQRNELKNLSKQDADEQMRALIGTVKLQQAGAMEDLQKIRSGSSATSADALAYMSNIQEQINKQTNTDPTRSEPAENTGTMMQNTSITKLQPNTHKLNISEDRITEINKEYQQVPEFKRIIG